MTSVPRPTSSPVGLVLELDPDLGAGVWPEDWEAARRVCRGELLSVPRGRWMAPEAAGDRSDILGMLIVEGLLCREVSLRGHHLLELLGPGEVLQLPVLATRPRLGPALALSAVTDAKLVVLGESFIRAGARWPSLLAAVQRRLETQREHLAIQGLIAHLPTAEERLLATLWHLAERFGYVTPQGTVLPLPFGHDILGQLGAAKRSTATLALRSLASEDAVHRLKDGSWLLTAVADRRMHAIAQTSHSSALLGEQLRLHKAAHDNIADSRALRSEAGQIRAHAAPRGRTRAPVPVTRLEAPDPQR